MMVSAGQVALGQPLRVEQSEQGDLVAPTHPASMPSR